MLITNLSALSLVLASDFSHKTYRQPGNNENSVLYEPGISKGLRIEKARFTNILVNAVFLSRKYESCIYFEKITTSEECTISECQFINCGSEQENGGAIESRSWSLCVLDCNFIQCKGKYSGGGIYVDSADLNASSVFFDQCYLFRDKLGESGCSIYVTNGEKVYIDDCSIMPFDGFENRCELFFNSAFLGIWNTTYSADNRPGNSFLSLQSETAELENVTVTHVAFVTSNVAIRCCARFLYFRYCCFANITGRNGVAITFAMPNCNVSIKNTSFIYIRGSSLSFNESANLIVENYCFSKNETEEITGAEWDNIVKEYVGTGYFSEGLCIPGRRFSVGELWSTENTIVASTVGAFMGLTIVISSIIYLCHRYNCICECKCDPDNLFEDSSEQGSSSGASD